jgi:glutamate racemase
MDIQPIKPRTAVALEDIQTKVTRTVFSVLPDTTTTVCQLFMENGYVILGTSACVDATKYNRAVGEKFAYEDAINKAWPLEGYLLAQERFLFNQTK